MRLLNKVAVITGGNSGIGFATARAFVAEGARVVLVGRRADAVETAVAALGDQATGVVGDVAELETHDAVTDFVSKRFGAADIYVANAGTIHIQLSAEVNPTDYDGQFLTVLTSSIASRKVLDGHAVYAGSKAAIEAFARNWALELKDRRIRVNVLSPGPTDTPIIGKLGVGGDALPAFEAEVARAIPFGRLADAEELARAAVFLASDDSAFVTGVNLAVDGGATLA